MPFDNIPSRSLQPQNIEAEENVLGGILIDPTAIARVVKEGLQPEDFYVQANQLIFGEMLELFRSGKPADLLILSTALSDKKLTEKTGGRAKLADLVSSAFSSVNIDRYALSIMEKSIRRRAIAKANNCIDKAFDSTQSEESLKSAASELVQMLYGSANKGDGGLKHISLTTASTFDQIERDAQNLDDPDYKGKILTGFYDLDDQLGGLDRGSLSIVLADTRVGKSTFTQNVCVNIAKRGQTVLYFTTGELSDELVTKRFLARESQLSLTALRSGRLIKTKERNDLKRLVSGVASLSELPLYIDSRNLTSDEIFQEVCNFQATNPEKEVAVVIVDYAQNIDKDSNAGIGHEQLAKSMGDLKRIAAHCDVHVMAPSQVKQSLSNRDNKRPQLDDIDGSKAIKDKPQLVLGLYRDELYDENSRDAGVMEIACLKCTNGEADWKVKVLADLEVSELRNMAGGDRY